MTPRIFTQPISEVYTLEECYHQLRVDPIDFDSNGENGTRPDDDHIMRLQRAARRYAEEFTGLSIALKVYELELTSFPATITLPFPPLVSVDAIAIDNGTSSNEIDPSEYTVDTTGQLAIISPVNSWPTLATGEVVRVLYRAGYGIAEHMSDADPIPEDLGIAILLAMSFWYSSREGEPLPSGVKALLRPFRVKLGMA